MVRAALLFSVMADMPEICLIVMVCAPSRYTITRQGMMVVASEVGVMDFEPGDVVSEEDQQPGKILLIDTQEGRIYYDGETKRAVGKSPSLPGMAQQRTVYSWRN